MTGLVIIKQTLEGCSLTALVGFLRLKVARLGSDRTEAAQSSISAASDSSSDLYESVLLAPGILIYTKPRQLRHGSCSQLGSSDG